MTCQENKIKFKLSFPTNIQLKSIKIITVFFDGNMKYSEFLIEIENFAFQSVAFRNSPIFEPKFNILLFCLFNYLSRYNLFWQRFLFNLLKVLPRQGFFKFELDLIGWNGDIQPFRIRQNSLIGQNPSNGIIFRQAFLWQPIFGTVIHSMMK